MNPADLHQLATAITNLAPNLAANYMFIAGAFGALIFGAGWLADRF